MERSIRFVTGNAGKLREARAALTGLVHLEQDGAGYVEVQADSLEEVARAGLEEVAQRLAPPFFLEDSGLFVAALDGFPGVYSAFVYAKLGCAGILRLLADTPAADRRAHFGSVIAYRDDGGRDHVFHGRVDGWVLRAEEGTHGFGYDPIFSPGSPDGPSFGELAPHEKNALSHRGRALAAFRSHLEGVGREKDS